jgi:uncharacterized membrane protein YbhN (UPF0104 family)
VSAAAPTASIGSFFDAIGSFFDSLSRVGWVPLGLGAVAFVVYLTLRSRAFFNTLRAAYPTERFQYRRIWGAYIASYGFNNVIPARGGDVIKLFLVKQSIPNATYPAVGAAICVEAIFDAVMAVFILTFSFTQGVFPKPPDFAKLGAFDLSFFASHPKFTLFAITLSAVLALVGFAVLSQRVKAFWARVRQGLTILGDRRRYMREVFLVQLAGWCFRFFAFWMLLDAFNVGGSVRNVLLVLGVNAVAAVVPFTPGGAGVQQALLVKVFGGGAASGATVAAYSVGQQIVIAVSTLATGFVALVAIFRIRSFKEALTLGKAERERERAAERAAAEREAAERAAAERESAAGPWGY